MIETGGQPCPGQVTGITLCSGGDVARRLAGRTNTVVTAAAGTIDAGVIE